MREYDVIVIGGGPAGMAAALGAADAGADVLLCERDKQLGGILSQCLHTGFGTVMFGREMTGPEFADEFIRRIEASPVRVRTGTMVTGLDASGRLTLSGASGFETVGAKAVVLASGCRERPAGALLLEGTRPAGVLTAGAAQRFINIGGYEVGRRAVILGSGDVGLIVAGRLCELGAEVVCVLEREERCGGLRRNHVRYIERYGIPLITRSTVVGVHGMPRVTGVTARSLDSGEEWDIPCDTLITSVGLVPERELMDGALLDGALPDWLFLCGNACYVHDAVDDVAEESERAGRAAAAFAVGGNRAVTVGEEKRRGDGKICLACPKACAVTKTQDDWIGMACGRTQPEFS